jgi:hypothetical protein
LHLLDGLQFFNESVPLADLDNVLLLQQLEQARARDTGIVYELFKSNYLAI